MFIIPVKLRFFLIAALLIGGIAISFLPYGLAWSWLLLVPGLILLVGYFLLGTIGPASKALQTGDLEKAEKMLDYTWKPNWMLKWNRGTYWFIKGSIAVQRREMSKAEDMMEKALSIGLPSDDFTAQVYLVLAQVAGSKNKRTAAMNHVKAAKKLKITEPMIIEGLKQIEKTLKMVPKGYRNQQQFGRMKRKKFKG
ncbi:MAG: hypothetical protein AAF502_13590 [Bacteroidota bacterium]